MQLRSFIGHLQYITEDKTSVIKRLSNLSTRDKNKLIKIFKDKPHLEDLKDKRGKPMIDWGNKNLVMADFKEVINFRSKNEIKRAVKEKGIAGLKKGVDYIPIVIKKNEDYLGYIPLTHEASVHIASHRIGRCVGKWCTAYTKDTQYWEEYMIDNKLVPIYILGQMYNYKDGWIDLKYAIVVHPSSSQYEMFNQEDNPVERMVGSGLRVERDIIKPNKARIKKAGDIIIENSANENDFVVDARTNGADYDIVDGIVVWQNGRWIDGTWHNGKWYGGVWEGGGWLDGTWYGGTHEQGIWEDGWWKDGFWENGIWRSGVWNDGNWYDGRWNNGTWKKGVWHDGVWDGGKWNGGLWKKGEWKEGVWNGGVWQTGIWRSGIWNEGDWNGGQWRDGSWRSGIWNRGEWLDGHWTKGTWYSGTWENGTWLNGIWHKGVWTDGLWAGGVWVNGLWLDGNWRGGTWHNGTWEGGVWEGGTWNDGTWLGGHWHGGYDNDGNYHDEGDSPDKWEKRK